MRKLFSTTVQVHLSCSLQIQMPNVIRPEHISTTHSPCFWQETGITIRNMPNIIKRTTLFKNWLRATCTFSTSQHFSFAQSWQFHSWTKNEGFVIWNLGVRNDRNWRIQEHFQKVCVYVFKKYILCHFGIKLCETRLTADLPTLNLPVEMEVTRRSIRNFNIPPRAYPGHLTVHRALGGGNLNVSLEGWGIWTGFISCSDVIGLWIFSVFAGSDGFTR